MKKGKQMHASRMELSLRINGETQRWTIAPGDLLLDVLRREGYYGVKRGCETGDCGACRVLLDGKPVNSCMIFAAQANGRELITIEGVAHGDLLDPLQQSLVEHAAIQCGFCTPGVVLSAQALLAAHPNATEEQVREALSGNLCRCTGYAGAVAAALEAARRLRAQRGG